MIVAHATVWIEAAILAVPSAIVLASVARTLRMRRRLPSTTPHEETER